MNIQFIYYKKRKSILYTHADTIRKLYTHYTHTIHTYIYNPLGKIAQSLTPELLPRKEYISRTDATTALR